MMLVLQAFGVVAGGLFVVGFAKGFVEAMVDQHRRRKKLRGGWMQWGSQS